MGVDVFIETQYVLQIYKKVTLCCSSTYQKRSKSLCILGAVHRVRYTCILEASVVIQ